MAKSSESPASGSTAEPGAISDGPTPAAGQVLAARPTPFGVLAAVDGLGGIAAPLLAGFSLALLGLVVQVEQDLRWPDLALVLLGGTVTVFVVAIQFTFRARQYAATPTQAKEWFPDFDVNPERQDRVYEELVAHLACHRFWVRRARQAYNVGVYVLLLGLAVVLVPAHHIGPIRLAAIVVVLMGGGVELTMQAAGWFLSLAQGGQRLPAWMMRLAWWLASGDPLLKPGR